MRHCISESHLKLILLLLARTSTPLIPSDEEQEADSEPDEGIHMPNTFRQNKSSEVSRMTACRVLSKDGAIGGSFPSCRHSLVGSATSL